MEKVRTEKSRMSNSYTDQANCCLNDCDNDCTNTKTNDRKAAELSGTQYSKRSNLRMISAVNFASNITEETVYIKLKNYLEFARHYHILVSVQTRSEPSVIRKDASFR